MEQISNTAIDMIRQNYKYADIRSYLIKQRDIGIKQDDMIAALEKCRSLAQNEDEEDLILELMDCASGYCSSFTRIYETQYILARAFRF